jgi:hypothetical protein
MVFAIFGGACWRACFAWERIGLDWILHLTLDTSRLEYSHSWWASASTARIHFLVPESLARSMCFLLEVSESESAVQWAFCAYIRPWTPKEIIEDMHSLCCHDTVFRRRIPEQNNRFSRQEVILISEGYSVEYDVNSAPVLLDRYGETN